MDIRNVIKEKRLEKKMTQEDLAKHFHVTRQLISKWENGKSFPDLDQIVVISDLFNIPLDELLRGDKEVVKQISLTAKTKKKLYITIFSLLGLSVTLGLFLLNIWLKEPVIISSDDVKITNIKKVKLPAKQELNEDVEYTFDIEITNPFISISNTTKSTQNNYNENDKVIISIQGQHSLFKSKKKSKVTVSSFRFKNHTNKNKDLYIKGDKETDIKLIANKQILNALPAN